ncbi:MAG: DNA-directed RNA polymerase subunit A'' [Thermoplasmatales archaeon]|nr:DNA-directed RNA polymerase subunit A'' [Thermoplasmatales archaeon]
MSKGAVFDGLLRRGVDEGDAEKIAAAFGTLKAVSEAKPEDLTAIGIPEGAAPGIIDAAGKRPPRKPAAAKAKKAVVEARAEPMELVSNPHVHTEDEKRLLAIAEAEGVELPLKLIIEIASRMSKAELDDEICRRLVLTAHEMFSRYQMEPNESAGMMAAQSIGEPGTQMNMRTFHHAGVANINVTLGLPRLIEIVDARRVPSTPSMTIPLTGLAREDEGVAKRVSYEIEMTSLLNVASVETDTTNMRVIVRPDAKKMSSRGVTLDDIVERLGKIRTLRGLVEVQEFDVVVTSDEPSFKRLQAIHDAVSNAKIKGIDGIHRAVLSKDKSSGWTIVTQGSNLKEVLKVEGIDARRTMTNSINEIGEVLGIEAARNSLIKEARDTLKDAGLNVDIRHLMLVADLMTNDGEVRAIGRHGISGKKSSVLARAAFEITAPHLLRAAINGEVDRLEGVAENIIVGQPVTLGTGAVNLIYRPIKKEGEQ